MTNVCKCIISLHIKQYALSKYNLGVSAPALSHDHAALVAAALS